MDDWCIFSELMLQKFLRGKNTARRRIIILKYSFWWTMNYVIQKNLNVLSEATWLLSEHSRHTLHDICTFDCLIYNGWWTTFRYTMVLAWLLHHRLYGYHRQSWDEVTPDCLKGVRGCVAWINQFQGLCWKTGRHLWQDCVALARKVDEEDVTDLLEKENTKDNNLEDLEEQIIQQTARMSDNEEDQKPEWRLWQTGEAFDCTES